MRRPAFPLLAALALVFAACSSGPRLLEKAEVREIGAPVKSLNWVRYHYGLDKAGGTAILMTAGQQGAGFFLLAIDPRTGSFRQFTSPDPKANYPTATCLSKSGKLYIGAAYAGHLYCYDPAAESLTDLGAIGADPKEVSFPCAIDEDASGRLWIGSYGTADLTSYDPATGTFDRRGRMDDVEMYNYPMVGPDGLIANRIAMVHPKIVVFDPKTGRKETVGPVATKGQDTFEAFKAEDGRVYIKSSLGDFRVDGFKAVPVTSIPGRSSVLPFREIREAKPSGPDVEPYRKLDLSFTDGTAKTIDLPYDAAGTEIFYLHRGPDGLLYGSSILPLHVFRYTPASGELVDVGRLPGGEAYSMGNLDGKLYISAYTGAELYAYDPAKPWTFSDKPESNPRDLGRMDKVSFRPRSTLTGPLGRVWVASLPDYGMWGGPLSWYDPASGTKTPYYNIAGEGSAYTLAYLEKAGLIAVGTSINGGSGTQPKITQAGLFLWDPAGEKKVWEGTLDRPVESVTALLALPDGRLLGTVTGGEGPELFVFDPASKSFAARIALPQGAPLELGLQLGPDGFAYGFTDSALYRLDPATLKVQVILALTEEFGAPGPIIDKDIYYAKGWTLKAARIFK